jgi:mannose-6-phosphate isomerase-like protein (cupin superfamily)
VDGFERIGDEIGAGGSVIAVNARPGDAALHRHTYAEVFVVLEGEATFTLGRLVQVDIHEHPRFDTEWL